MSHPFDQYRRLYDLQPIHAATATRGRQPVVSNGGARSSWRRFLPSWRSVQLLVCTLSAWAAVIGLVAWVYQP